MKKEKKHWRYFTGFTFFLIISLGVLFYFYTSKIHFTGKIECIPENAVQQVETTSPLNKKQIFSEYDKNISGYFREITLTYKPKDTIPLVYQIFDEHKVLLQHRRKSANTYQLIYPEISITQKIKAVVRYNNNRLLEIILLSTFLLTIFIFIHYLFRKKKKSHSAIADRSLNVSKQNVLLTNIVTKFSQWFEFVKHQKYSVLAAAVISLAVYPCLLYCFGIDFSTIYNASHQLLYIIISILSFIPLSGLFLRNKSHYFGLGFFAFWLIFLLHYFIISPFLFTGNFGFHGAFQDFLMVAVYENFFRGLFIPDVGYLAVLPRLAYGISTWLSPDASQSIAITSIISLTCYSFIFGFFAGNKFKFLWPSPESGFIFIVLLAAIPVFSLVPGINFYLPITDTAYYGLVFSFYVLFIIKELKPPAVYLLTIINCIFILSKAHFLVIFPVYLVALFIFYRCRNRKGIILTLFSLIALTGQGVFCYFGMLGLKANDVAIGSFSLQTFSFTEQILLVFTYYLKAYIHLLMPFINTGGPKVIIPIIIMFLIVIFLLIVAIKMIINKNKNLVGLWFITGNAIAFLSTAFYIYTLPANGRINTDGIINLINSTDINLMRYTVGVHTILPIAVIPFILYLFSIWFKRISQRYAAKMTVVLLYIALFASVIFSYAPSNFMHFWSMSKGDKWSYEWKHLVPLIKNKAFYIPVVFYPAYKQTIKTDNLEVAEDIIPRNASGFSLKEKKEIHAIIVLNASENKKEQQPVKAETFYKGEKNSSIAALYPTEPCMRFTYFLINSRKPADSISFVNQFKQPALINTHIRIVSYKKYADIKPAKKKV